MFILVTAAKILFRNWSFVGIDQANGGILFRLIKLKFRYIPCQSPLLSQKTEPVGYASFIDRSGLGKGGVVGGRVDDVTG